MSYSTPRILSTLCMGLLIFSSSVQAQRLVPGVRSAGHSFDDFNGDAAYDETNNLYAVSYLGGSGTNARIRCRIIDGTTAANIRLLTISSSGSLVRNAQIASINSEDSFIVTWEEDVNGQYDIMARAVRAIDGVMSPIVVVAGTGADEITPDIAGEATTSDDEAIVIYNEVNGAMYAVELTLNSNSLTPGTPVVITADTAAADPAISKSGGSNGELMAVWQTSDAVDTYVGYRRLDRNVKLGTPNANIPAGGRNISSPDVDGDGTRWGIVWQQLEVPGGTSHDIWGIEFEDCPTGLCTGGIKPIDIEIGDDEITPAIAMLGPKYAVTWSDLFATNPTEHHYEVASLEPGSFQICGLNETTGHGGGTAGFACDNGYIGAKFAGGSSENTAILGFTREDLSNSKHVVMKQFYGPYGPTTVTPVSPVCGTGGTCATNGPFASGNNAFAVTLTGADPTAGVGAFNVGLPGAPAINCGTCQILTPTVSVAIAVTSGASSVNIPVPCDPLLNGLRLDVQWLMITSSINPCPLLPNLAASNAIGITIAN